MKKSAILFFGLAAAIIGVSTLTGRLLSLRPDDVAPPPKHGPVGMDMPDFSLTDQDGKPVSRHDLDGKVWVADYIFIQCSSSCYVLSTRIADLQKRLDSSKLPFISFSISPDDTRPVLKEYEGKFRRNDAQGWRLLAPDAAVVPTMLVSFGLAQSPADARKGVADIDPHFFLVDRSGKIVGAYDGTNADECDRLVADASKLLDQQVAP